MRYLRHTTLFVFMLTLPFMCLAEDEILWERNFDEEALGDVTGQVVFFANGSRNPEGDGGRVSSTWAIVEEPDNPSGRALQNIGGALDDHDSWYFEDTLNNPAINQGQYKSVQCDLWIPDAAQGDGNFRVGLFGYIDTNKTNSYGAWFKWSERKLRVGKLEQGQEVNVKTDEFSAVEGTNQWYTLRCDYKDLGGGQLEVTATIFPRDNAANTFSAKNVVAYDAENGFGIGLYMYSNDREQKIWDNFKAVRPAAKRNLIWENTFDDQPLGDYTNQLIFFENGSRNPGDDGGRASSLWDIALDPLDSNNQVLQNVGGTEDEHDSWYFSSTVGDPNVSKGSYNIVQADVFIPDEAQGDGNFRVGLFGLIDLDKTNSYGAWFKWSERKLRVGKLEQGQEVNVKTPEFANDADTNRWYTIKLDFKNLGAGQLEVTGTIFPKDNPSTVFSAKNVVAYDAEKDFAVGLYMYSNDRPFKMWDNVQAIEEIRPQANAGMPFRVVAGSKNVTLDGSKSAGAQTYKWEVVLRERIIDPTQADESHVGEVELDPEQTIPEIRNADQAIASFDVPDSIPYGAERLTFKLTINEGTDDESDATVLVYLQEFGGALTTRDGFAAPQGGWDYAWDGDVSPLSVMGKFKKNFSYNYDLGSHGQSDPVPPSGYAEDWGGGLVTLHREDTLIICRWTGNNIGTYLDLNQIFANLGDAGIFDETGATMLIRARNNDVFKEDGSGFTVFPYPFDSRTGIDGDDSVNPDTTLLQGGTRVGFGSKIQDAEAVIAFGDLDDVLYIIKGPGEYAYDAGIPVPDISTNDFNSLWITVNTQNGRQYVTVYNEPDSNPIIQEEVSRPARRQNPSLDNSPMDPNISDNYFRVDLEDREDTIVNALCIDYICLKRGTFPPSSIEPSVGTWMLY